MLHSTAAAAEVVAEAATDEVGSSVVVMSNVVEVPRAVEVSAEVESESVSVVSVEPTLVRDSVNDSLTVADEVSVVRVSTVVVVSTVEEEGLQGPALTALAASNASTPVRNRDETMFN